MLKWKVPKLPSLSVVSYADIAFVIYTGIFSFYRSANLVDITACQIYTAPQNPSDVSEAAVKSKENTMGSRPLLHKQATIEEEEDDDTEKFGPRQFLSADSLLKSNPQACLMIISKSLDTKRGYKILKPFLDRGFKVVAVTPDVPFLVRNTPAEAWLEDIKNGKSDPGAVLYKYGGVYMDTDFLVLKNFKGLRNAVGVQIIDEASQNWTSVNGALQIFDIWHPMLFQFMKEYATNFSPHIWGENGPYLVSRVIKRLGAGRSPVYNISILPRKAFYPVDWVNISRLYKKPATEEESKWVEETMAKLSRESYAIHLWNQVSKRMVTEEGSVIDRLYASHCLICYKIT
ncbi:lactosylceramide 4-alpha-galactosyltransferase-like [Mangifera indica]|uniref:lactosylceramide 4-alpha-galactosyltransferase-like n=1 Tax=Mangifera indica TaxID=29780 RepID=UPI001CF9C28F|nr:lactosylceramide 4-alpha-galactosyltransferase-like [Mangifera indica]